MIFLNQGKWKALTFSRFLPCLLSLLFLPPGLSAQELIRISYERNFIRASLAAKTGILMDASTDERSREFIGDLYEFALQFALTNGEYLREDPDMITLVGTASRGAAVSGNAESAKTLWDLFRVYTDPYSRVEILMALGRLGMGNPQVIANLNLFLDEQNSIYRRGGGAQSFAGFEGFSGSAPIDYSIISACVAALAAFGDESSFPFLFSAMTAGYSQAITDETRRALESLNGNYYEYLVDIIRKNPFPEKTAAFRMGVYNNKLSLPERGGLALLALDVSLNALPSASAESSITAGNFSTAESSLRYEAVIALTRMRWTPAASLAIRNFYQVRTDYGLGIASRERLLEAISCLGVMGSSDAAQALALHLGYFNSDTERTGEFDEELILAMINALGDLGDKSAFDNLLYVHYLNYPDRIEAAAREALNRLKW